MTYTRLAPLTLLTITLACNSDPADTTTGSSTTTGDPTTTATTTATTTSTTDEVTTTASTTTTDTSTTTEAPTTTTEATTTPATTDTTTGEAAFCHGWDGPDGPPHLELRNNGILLAEAGTLTLECGGQGLFMFGLYPTFGGFIPEGDGITFAVTVDVDGHNTDPSGHFFSTEDYVYYVGCEDLIGGVFGVVPVLPPDNEDPLTLDGLPATVKVTLNIPGDPLTLEFAVTLAVDPSDPSFGFCGG